MSYEATLRRVLEAFGLNPKRHLPAEGTDGLFIDGVDTWILPLSPVNPTTGRRRFRHRVVCSCPTCGRQLSRGRLHQHQDTARCRANAQRNLQRTIEL